MLRIQKFALAVLMAATGLAAQVAYAQPAAPGRVDLLKADLDSTLEVLQVRVDFPPGVVSPYHSHPGVEIAHVLEGVLVYELEGRPPVTLKAGDSLFIPAGTKHLARNVGPGKASELATYLVRKGEPLLKIFK